VVQFGQYPAPRHVVAHLSDPHLLADGQRQYGVVDPEHGLQLALERVARLVPAPQVLVFTGDLADKAEPAAYARLREYAKGLFDLEDDGVQDRVHEVDGLRIIALDTSVPGYHHGELTDDQLAWLRDQLATPAPHGTLLALHHPPIPVPMLRAAEIIELDDQHQLAEALAGSDVRAILGGHFHFTSWSTFAGIPVSVASASCYTSDPAPLARFVSGVDGHQAITMLHLYDDRVVNSVVPLAPAPEVSGYPADVIAQVEALSHDERRDLLSRKDSPFNQDEEKGNAGRET
jgi:Icc protein